jgi:hypothetical protein
MLPKEGEVLPDAPRGEVAPPAETETPEGIEQAAG